MSLLASNLAETRSSKFPAVAVELFLKELNLFLPIVDPDISTRTTLRSVLAAAAVEKCPRLSSVMLEFVRRVEDDVDVSKQ